MNWVDPYKVAYNDQLKHDTARLWAIIAKLREENKELKRAIR